METINDLLNQISNLSAGCLVVLAVLATGYVVKAIPAIPNQLIPIITFAVAVGGTYALGDTSKVSFESRNPQVRLAFVGVAYWGIGWLLHNQGLRRLEKFLPTPLRGLIGVAEEKPQPPKPDILPLP